MSDQSPVRELLVSLQRYEFNRAGRFDKIQLSILASASLLAGVSVVFRGGQLANVAAIASLALALAAFWFLHKNREHRAVAERIRRATLLIDGLGLELSPSELRRYAAASHLSGKELGAWNDPTYFASHEKPSVKRALEMLEESAFWSAQLLKESGDITRLLLLTLSGILIFCLLFSISLLGNGHVAGVVRLFSSLASSLVWIELLARTVHYYRAARDVEEILLRLDSIRSNGYRKDDWILALVDYNSTVEAAPMIFPGVFSRNKTRLEALWQGRTLAPSESRRAWVIPNNDLEAQTIVDLLSARGERTLVSSQPWGAKWDGLEAGHKTELQSAVAQGAQIYGVELAGSNPYRAVNIDHHRYTTENRWRPDSSLEQVASLIGVDLTRWQLLVAANDRGYIPEMIRVGATQEEVAAIRLSDRRAQGITESDEKRAEDEVADAMDCGHGRLIVTCDRPTSAHTDLLFGNAVELLLVGRQQMLYTGPRAAELASMDVPAERWSGGQAENGYCGFAKPGPETRNQIRSWFAGNEAPPL